MINNFPRCKPYVSAQNARDIRSSDDYNLQIPNESHTKQELA
jgi:hypothetical protein